ncbi:hypothetical protein FGF62_12300 [Neisseria meningitidis]|uniref:DUF6012 family protein n=1 Tax=Neisseria meningitidis TaxID=487 RepID=UPI001F5CD72F|nr:DUF6012 family protein [Neisseria meningitidis]MCI3164094.1 hypothetical protein [Neisseria meningitidis]
MFYHIIPKYFADTTDREIKLATLEIPELGLKLSDKELKTIKPYPNKKYSIGCLRHGFKGRNFIGLVVETERFVSDFTKICTWTVYPQPRGEPDIAFIMTHTTKYNLLENNNLLFSEDNPSRSNRRLQENYCDTSVMEFCHPYLFTGINVQDMHNKCHDDFYEVKGVIIHREQQIETYTTDIVAYRDKCTMSSKKLPPLETAMKLHNI